MGRHKIQIKRIDNPKMRVTTFNKRKTGLFKKAFELAELTNANVTLLVRSESGKNYMFQSGGESLAQAISYEYERLAKEQICEYSENADQNEVQEPLVSFSQPQPKVQPQPVIHMHKKHLDIQIPTAINMPALQDINNQFASPTADGGQQDIMADNAMQSPMYFMINTPNQGPVMVSTPGGVACQMIFPKQ